MLSLGLSVRLATRFRKPSKVFLNWLALVLNTWARVSVRLTWFIMAMALLLSGSTLLLLPFSPVMYIVLRWVSMCVHSKKSSSPIRAPVSFSICSRAFVVGVPEAIKRSSSSSVGIKGNSLLVLYRGIS